MRQVRTDCAPATFTGVSSPWISQIPSWGHFMTAAYRINTFTDTDPSFPYQSSEASGNLSIPDSSAVHLAITDLASRLLELPVAQSKDRGDARCSALRCASYGVLMRHPFEQIEYRYMAYLNAPLDHAAFDKAENAKPVNWLGLAAAFLEAEGVPVEAEIQKRATPYGWVGLSQVNEKSAGKAANSQSS